jgi:hypothetical protein
VSHLHQLSVSVRIIEIKPLQLIQIANEMVTYSLRV